MKITFKRLAKKCSNLFRGIAKKAAKLCERRKYRIKITRFHKSSDEAYLVIHNRHTDFDRAIVEKTFRERMYSPDSIKEGSSVLISDESMRCASVDGIKDLSVVKLARELELPIALFRIEGELPPSKKRRERPRRAIMRAGVSKVIYPGIYATMSDDELYQVIIRELKAK